MFISQFGIKKKSRLVESYEITEAGIAFGPETGKESYPAGYASDGQMIMHIVRDLLPRLRDDQMTLDVMRSLEAIEKGRPTEAQMQQVMDVYKAAETAGIVQQYKDAIGKFSDEEEEEDLDFDESVQEATWINGEKQDDKELVWKQTSMSYEEACKKYGKENCKIEGKTNRGEDAVLVKVPRVAEDEHSGATQEEVASAIAGRFMRSPDLLSKVLEKSDIEQLTAAIDDVASFHEGAEELGSSDISGMVKQVMRQLGITERKLTKTELKKREDNVMDLKPHKGDFEKRYGKDAESVMYAVATKRAKKESIDESILRQYQEAGFFDI